MMLLPEVASLSASLVSGLEVLEAQVCVCPLDIDSQRMSTVKSEFSFAEEDLPVSQGRILTGLSEVMLNHSTQMEEVLARYHECYPKALDTYLRLQGTRSQLDEYLHGEAINDYLIMPVQRAPRYKMLVETLLHQCEKRGYGGATGAGEGVQQALVGVLFFESQCFPTGNATIHLTFECFVFAQEDLLPPPGLRAGHLCLHCHRGGSGSG